MLARNLRLLTYSAIALNTLLIFTAPSTPASEGSPSSDAGGRRYAELCASCHGKELVTLGITAPDLRKLLADDFERFKAAVLDGSPRGMPGFREEVDEEDLRNLWAYVRSGG